MVIMPSLSWHFHLFFVRDTFSNCAMTTFGQSSSSSLSLLTSDKLSVSSSAGFSGSARSSDPSCGQEANLHVGKLYFEACICHDQMQK